MMSEYQVLAFKDYVASYDPAPHCPAYSAVQMTPRPPDAEYLNLDGAPRTIAI